MADSHQKLATSLDVLSRLQADGQRVFQSGEIARLHRERLLRNGYLHRIIKGWLISTSPDVEQGDSTPWFGAFWEFCARYCHQRFGQNWCLSPEQSLLIHAGNMAIPRQVVIRSSSGKNNAISLPFETSLFDMQQKDMPPLEDLTEADQLRVYTIDAALVSVTESFYRRYSVEAQVVLSQLAEPSDLLRRLLAGGHSTVAGRLVGALRRVGKTDTADNIASAMKAADYPIREADPFDANLQVLSAQSKVVPIVARLRALWRNHRAAVQDSFPASSGGPGDRAARLRMIDEVYVDDAYHSLSIEGYRVTERLVERVRSGEWRPESDAADRENRNALAARGYWQAFQLVKSDIAQVYEGESAGEVVRRRHGEWYRELFQPSVVAGIVEPAMLAGYRNIPVYIRTSRYVPPRWEMVREAMPVLFDLLSEEENTGVRAVLGHWLFGYIHPYPDGNGRIARFLMNLMLASGGYPWTVINVEDRDAYLNAMNVASVDDDIEPFARFIGERVRQATGEGA